MTDNEKKLAEQIEEVLKLNPLKEGVLAIMGFGHQSHNIVNDEFHSNYENK